jgi:uncharacterized membrane protein YobD (UPF0266 family)
MIGYVIIPIAVYIGIDLVKLYRRSQYILTSGEILYYQPRKKMAFTASDFFGLSTSIMMLTMMIKASDFSSAWLFIPVIYQAIRDKRMKKEDIILYEDGMVFDKTYIRWKDVYKAKLSGYSAVTIESYNFVLGEFTISNLESPEELERKINYLIQSEKQE